MTTPASMSMPQTAAPRPIRRLGVMAALHDELRAFLAHVSEQGSQQSGSERSVQRHGGRDFHCLRWQQLELVVVLAGVGKVAAAATATLLADRFAVDAMVFTGVAGGLAKGLKVGDVVVADALLQHDMDASPLFPRHEVPLLGLSRFAACAHLGHGLQACAEQVLKHLSRDLSLETRVSFGLQSPAVHRGLVVSGDRFVSTAHERDQLLASVPDALVVEMEGAAVAQVCHAFELPLTVVRTVSDLADDSAHVDFPRFTADVASHYSASMLHQWLDELNQAAQV